MPDSAALNGHCYACGETVCEILQQYPRDHPLAGWPIRTGHLMPGLVKVTLWLSDLTYMSVVVHGECSTGLDLASLWFFVTRAWELEQEAKRHRVTPDLIPTTPNADCPMMARRSRLRPLGIAFMEEIRHV